MAITDKLTLIADAIRDKTGKTDILTLEQMPTEIAGIEGGGNLQEKTVTENGIVLPDEGYDGMSKVTVNVEGRGNYDIISVDDNDGTQTLSIVDAPVGVNRENKLSQIIDRSVTEITAEDLAGTTKIGEYAFYVCKKLVKVTIPNNITKIDSYAFYQCPLTSIDIPSSVTELGMYVFVYTKFEHVTFKDGLLKIGNGLFQNCQSLKTVYIPDTVTSVGGTMFTGATNLESVRLSNNIREIGYGFFQNCQKLTTVTLPTALGSMNTDIFSGCSSLKSIIVTSSNRVPTIQSGTFKGIPEDCKIYVPGESVEAYKAATNWSAYADRIFAIEE